MANPVLSRTDFANARALPAEGQMTLAGAIGKTGLLMLLCGLAAVATWLTTTSIGPSMPTAITVTAIVGLVIGLATTFKPKWAPVTAPLYAIVEGVLLGGITMLINVRYAGLPLTALALTVLTGGVMLTLYATRVVRVTHRFRAIVMGAILAIMLYYVLSMVLGFFHVQAPLMQGSSWMSIGFSLIVVGVASLSFLLDFDMIEQAANHGAPKYMEWYGAFGVLVTFVWLYLEVMRLLMKLADRR